MKTVGIIAEYNPLHLGHIKQIEYVKNVLKADKIIVIMSGNFTQRGESAVLNKFIRAKEAVKAGANAVIELPTVFAVSNAEIFAKGAIKILNSLKIIDEICFGVESGSKEDYITLAKALNKESKEYKSGIKKYLEKGVSLAKAKFSALKDLNIKGLNEELLSSPNNILGVEYTKAILSTRSKIKIEPLIRENTHNDKKLKGKITSALSIRETLKKDKIKKVKNNVPKFVYKDLTYPPIFDDIILTSLATEKAENMANILDCTEGLENRIKALLKDNLSVNKLVEKVSTKRYTETRIMRIIISNLLKIDKNLIISALNEKLYVKVLAINKDEKDFLSLISKKAKYPLLLRKSDADKLNGIGRECFKIDVLANDLYNIVTKEKTNENTTLFV